MDKYHPPKPGPDEMTIADIELLAINLNREQDDRIAKVYATKAAVELLRAWVSPYILAIKAGIGLVLTSVILALVGLIITAGR